MNTKKEKIFKVSKILNVFLKIGVVVSILIIVGAIVAILAAPSLDSTLFTISGIWGNVSLNAGINEFRTMLISEILNTGVVAAILLIASFIFKDMSRENTPFTKKNANRLKAIAILAITFSIIVQPLRMLLSLFFIPSVDIYVSINPGYLLFAVMFFSLALIFEYGTKLQQESDETL